MARLPVTGKHAQAWQGVHPAIRQFFMGLYGYIDTSARQNYIGAEAQAFAKQSLPLYEWKGPGEVVRHQLIATAPQVAVTQTPVPTGIAGIAAGQIWNGQLIDNPNNGDTLQQEIV